ncbi:MAG: hypothetical protein HOP17_07100 [Acidobacteria bacterium]|nr:hypothetical protein [Acidobacteriota bacterium]
MFGIYVLGIWQNPPGYYVDESALSYNAYLVSQTGAGEFGPKFPLFFQIYSGGFTQYSNPTQIYLLAILFKVFGPGILTARLFAAACVFAASCLLGFLARRISGKILIGALVGATALFTPWLFEVGRLVLETFFYPMAVVLLLWSIFRVSAKDKWNYPDVGLITFSLTLLTYSYTIGRVLGPLLAGGLIIFAVNRQRIFSILKVWALFGSTLIPLIVYASRNPELTKRFYLLSYITPESTFSEIFVNFAVRFLEDVNPVTMLLTGDINTRHHIDGAFGSFYLSAFALAVTGMVIIFLRYSRSSWWWYVLYGLLASAVPGALTVDSFHTLRMIAYPIFLLLLMVPALEWLLEDLTVGAGPSFDPRQVFTLVLLFLFVFEATYFHTTYYRRGPDRTEAFDADFKPLYESAVARPERPIYLFDGYWGPAYMHAFWYATLEARDTGEFVHQPFRVRPPAEVLVLSSEENCSNCQLIERKGNYILYLTNPMESEASAKAR